MTDIMDTNTYIIFFIRSKNLEKVDFLLYTFHISEIFHHNPNKEMKEKRNRRIEMNIMLILWEIIIIVCL